MARKVRYCVNNEFFGVLHLHSSESGEQTPFVQIVPEGLLPLCRKLKKGAVVLVELGQSGEVRSFKSEGGSR